VEFPVTGCPLRGGGEDLFYIFQGEKKKRAFDRPAVPGCEAEMWAIET